jgi:MFS transporter, FHS family, glucose/mannose:H+ symporter
MVGAPGRAGRTASDEVRFVVPEGVVAIEGQHPRGHAVDDRPGVQVVTEETHLGQRLVLNRAALAAVAACFLLMGTLAAAYGPLLEHLARRFAITLPIAGEVFSAHFAGALVGVLVSMWAMERIAGRLAVWAALGCLVVGCTGIALAPSWPAFLTAAFFIGLGYGGLDVGLNQLIVHSEGPRRSAVLNGLNGAYGFGAVAGPILISRFGADHLPILFGGAAVIAVALVPAAAGISGRLPVVARTGRGWPGLLVGIFLAAYVFYVGLEIGVGGWMTSHLESAGQLSLDAATITSGFWLAIALGRVLAALIPDSVSPPKILIACCAVASIALLAALNGTAAPLAYIVTGFAIAPIFPTGIAWLATLRPGDSRATSWVFPASMIGGVVIPAGIGLAIASLGIGWAPAVLSLVGICMLLAFGTAGLKARE